MKEKILEISRKVKNLGGEAYLVGGYVRDMLLNKEPKDGDIEVYRVEPRVLKQVLSTCGKVDCVGESFKVYKLSWYENNQRFEIDVSVPREDKKIGDGHKGFEVVGNPYASFEEATRRRDFTINSILYNPLTQEFIDPFGGRQDLENRIIRATDEKHFAEDPLRVLRALQFAGRFNFQIDDDTASLCRTIDLTELPKERVWEEFKKLFQKSQYPLGTLHHNYKKLGIEKLITSLDQINFDFIGAAYGAFDKLETLELDDETKLVLKFAYPIAAEVELIDKFIEEVGMINEGNKFVERVKQVAASFEVPYNVFFSHNEWEYDLKEGDIRRIALDYPVKDLYYLVLLGDISVAEYFKKRLVELDVWDSPPEPLLMGKHLLEMGMKPGPEMGILLKEVFEKQLDGFVTTLEQAKQLAGISLKYSGNVSIN